MKSSVQQSKPTLSARPPVPMARSAAVDLENLEKVAGITEAPAKLAAQMLEGAGEGAPPVQSPEPAAKVKPVKGGLPWEEVDDGVVSFNFKLPSKLGAKLKYLGETTYQESMTSIVIDALGPRLDKMLKERGLI